MPQLITAEALSNFRVRLSYDDGITGEVDLSPLVGRGVFAAWNDVASFNQVRIGEFGELVWDNNIELCPDSLYLQVTGKSLEEIFPDMSANSHA